MEWHQEGAACSVCSATNLLYASQCTHIDPICLPCATKFAHNNHSCAACGHNLTKIIRRYNLKPCSAARPPKFVGKFPSRPNEAKYFKKSDSRKWFIHREGGSKLKSRAPKPWVLQHVEDEMQYTGKIRSDAKNFYMLIADNKRAPHELTVHPIKSWYDFQKDIQYNTLTLEEAEKEMNGWKRNQKEFGRWIMKDKMENPEKGAKSRLVIDENDNDEGDAYEYNWEDENSNKKQNIKVQEEGEGEGEGEEEDSETKDKKIKKKNHTNIDPEDENNEKGEEWEHEKDYDDDDEKLKVESPHSSKESESSESIPDHISDFEDDENINEVGKEMKILLKKENGEVKDEDKEHFKDGEVESNLKDEDGDAKRGDFSKNQIEENGRKRKLSNEVLQASNSVSKRTRPDLRSIVRDFFKTGPKTQHELKKFITEKVSENLKGDAKELIKKICKRDKNGNVFLK